MKDPIDYFSTLVMSIFNNKGVYALLLGSGISLPAKILSGWKVMEDLIKKLAAVQGDGIPKDAFDWFKNKYGCDVEYPKLLEQLGRKPAEMESLLQGYFEPSAEDRNLGYKKPTVAHKAIAEMAGRGYFKVIITTNFDRLIETALDEDGVKYQVINNESEIESRIPIYHHPLTILKVNGDYKDCRFRNTEDELSHYPQVLIDYLDAILKNFGLISCGWSASWDKALIKEIEKNSEHRYSYYYTFLGSKSQEIDSLETKSKGVALQIEDADSFFTEMNERLKALEKIEGLKMETDVAVAVERVKMYIADPQKIIQYTDLFENVTEQLLNEVKDRIYGADYPSVTLFENAIADNVNSLSILIPMSIVAIRWATRDHYAAIVDSLFKMANRKIEKPGRYYDDTKRINRVLDTAYLYGIGMSCIYYKKFGLLDLLFRSEFVNREDFLSPYIIGSDNCWVVDSTIWNNLSSYQRLRTPFSMTLFNSLMPLFTMINDEKDYYSIACIFEKLLAMYFYMLICKNESIKIWEFFVGNHSIWKKQADPFTKISLKQWRVKKRVVCC